MTISVADAVSPGPDSVAVMAEVVSRMRPRAAPRTCSVTLHEAPAARLFDVEKKVDPTILRWYPPPVVPVPHVPAVSVIRDRPAGSVSVKFTFVSASETLGFVTVIVRLEFPPTCTVVGLNDAVIVAPLPRP